MPNANGNGWKWLGRLTAGLALAGAIAAGAVNWDRMNRHIGNPDRHTAAAVAEQLREVNRRLDRYERIMCAMIEESDIRSSDCPETLKR